MKLELDPNWWVRNITSSPPLPPQAILYGDVVVGYRHEKGLRADERFVAVGGDIEIQKVIDEFARDLLQQRERAREAQDASDRTAAAAEGERKRRAARKALGLDAQDDGKERK